MFEFPRIATLALLAQASSVLALPTVLPRQSSDGTIVAITGAQGSVQPRLEINQLLQNEDQWNIYLLAMQAFQAMDVSDPLSWYQISGIHGVPYVPYNGVEQCPGCPTTGYCTHSSTLFPVWHRSYTALFEQSLSLNAIAVANKFSGSQRTKYMNVAKTLRAPYWDWALLPTAGEPAFPTLFTDETVTVTTPSGQQTIANPLRSYSFGSADHSFMQTAYTPYSDVTVRNPTFTYEIRESLQADLYQCLTSNQGYTSFSTESLTSYLDNYTPYSIEMIHDRVHYRTGGDMAFIPTAGFDPIFFLHHAAVDHAFALWQAAHPTEWMAPWKEVGSTFTYTAGTIEDDESDLTPFHSDSSGGFWNANALRDTKVLGYTYADIASGQSAASIINTLYGGGAGGASKRGTKKSHRRHTEPEYTLDIRVDSMKAEGSFAVYFFAGEFDEDDCSSWHNTSSLVATHGFLTGPRVTGDNDELTNAAVSLNPALRKQIKAGKLQSLDVKDVKPFLENKLQYRIKTLRGDIAESSSYRGFDVALLTSTKALPENDEELPTWSPFKLLMKL